MLGRRPYRYDVSEWGHTTEEERNKVILLRDELDKEGYDLIITEEVIEVRRRHSVFSYVCNGKISKHLFQTRRDAERFVFETVKLPQKQANIIELEIR